MTRIDRAAIILATAVALGAMLIIAAIAFSAETEEVQAPAKIEQPAEPVQRWPCARFRCLCCEMQWDECISHCGGDIWDPCYDECYSQREECLRTCG